MLHSALSPLSPLSPPLLTPKTLFFSSLPLLASKQFVTSTVCENEGDHSGSKVTNFCPSYMH